MVFYFDLTAVFNDLLNEKLSHVPVIVSMDCIVSFSALIKSKDPK